MKNLFWIVSGVLVLGLVIAWLVLVPVDETRESKKKLDNQTKDLQDLYKRAKNTPSGVFDLENPNDTKRLQSDFLATPKWKTVLQPFMDKYQTQLEEISKQLVARSEFLKKPVAPSTDFSAWYSAYLKQSETLVKRLKDAGCLRAPKPITAPTGDQAVAPSDESPAEMRRAAGLFTKAGEFPPPKDHPLLTARLHAMEMLADRLIAARIAIADNPVIKATGRADDRASSPVVINQVDWSAPANDAAFGTPIRTPVSDLLGTQAMSLKLTLDGPLSALLSAVGALDQNADNDRPLVALGAVTLTRRADFLAGDRDDVAAETARLEVMVTIVYFSPEPIAVGDAPGGPPGGGMGGGPPVMGGPFPNQPPQGFGPPGGMAPPGGHKQ